VRTLFGFIAGVALCSLILFGARVVLPVYAANESGETSENTTDYLSTLLPDIENIYRDALTSPFQKAESKITDPDIAEFYRELMDKTGLAPRDSQ
jgi:hypothetical protein